MNLLRAILLLSLAWSAGAMAEPRDYRIDPVHTRVAFSIGHLGLSRAIGTFSSPRGWISFNPDDLSSARGEVELDLSTLDLGDADWNRRMARGDSLDSERHPIARWRVERVEPTGERSFNAHGLLRFRGGEYPLTLAVAFNGVKRHPLTLRRTAGFSARATLSRATFGIDKWKSMVGDVVELQVEVEARRGKRRADGGFDEDPADSRENDDAMAQ